MKQIIQALFISLLLTACSVNNDSVTLTILHTNDTHSQIEPKETDNNGGYARRMGIIAEQRQLDPTLILLDAGDFWQGTPYFNFFNGEVEIEAMNRMRYDAATLGNHEFDYGVAALAEQLKKAKFPIVCANYQVEDTPLDGIVKPYTIISRKGLKIGVIGLGVKPYSLVAADNFAPLVWQHPFPIANDLADMLKHKKHCDIVIALSHLGTRSSHGEEDNICDITLAQQSSDIDIIIGGHTHQVENMYVTNKVGKDILIVQTGKSGINLGKISVVCSSENND